MEGEKAEHKVTKDKKEEKHQTKEKSEKKDKKEKKEKKPKKEKKDKKETSGEGGGDEKKKAKKKKEKKKTDEAAAPLATPTKTHAEEEHKNVEEINNAEHHELSPEEIKAQLHKKPKKSILKKEGEENEVTKRELINIINPPQQLHSNSVSLVAPPPPQINYCRIERVLAWVAWSKCQKPKLTSPRNSLSSKERKVNQSYQHHHDDAGQAGCDHDFLALPCFEFALLFHACSFFALVLEFSYKSAH